MGNHQVPRRKDMRKINAKPQRLEEIPIALEQQCVFFRFNSKRHADAKTNVLFQPGWSGKPFRTMYDMRKPLGATVLAHPELSTALTVFGHNNDGWLANH